jgi:hypothetical protein
MVTSPMALWACPAHSAVSSGQESAKAHVMGHMPMGHTMPVGHNTPSGHHHNECPCAGCCCSVAAVGLTPGRLVSLPVVPVTIVAQAPAPALGAPRESTPHLRLPLPLGPPALRV